jgi:hypothetical protein
MVTHPARVHLAYSCRFPSGPKQVGVTVAARFPASAASGKPIRPTGLLTTVKLPHGSLADLAKTGATKVTASDILALTIGTGIGADTTVQWPGQMATPAPLPRTGSLRLPIPGRALPDTARGPGAVTFTVAGLALAFTSGRPGTATAQPTTVQAACTLDPGQQATLDTVPAISPIPSPSGTPSHTGSKRAAKGSATSSPAFSGLPPGCGQQIVHGGTSSPLLGCAYLIGYADVNKLHGAALVGPGHKDSPPGALIDVDTFATDTACVPQEPTLTACLNNPKATLHIYSCTEAQLNFDKQPAFPPTAATFLTFGFAPVTAVIQLSETAWPSTQPPIEDARCYKGGYINTPVVRLKSPLISVFTDINGNIALNEPVVSTGTTYLILHVSKVWVNGVPLPVGASCGIAQPMKAVLTGKGFSITSQGYTVIGGGPLTGSVTIPTFTHCGVGENIDPLLNASISGPANFQLITQGPVCVPKPTPANCPPTVPTPRRHL